MVIMLHAMQRCHSEKVFVIHICVSQREPNLDFLVSYVGERPWWPIHSPNKGERRMQKAKSRERSDQVY